MNRYTKLRLRRQVRNRKKSIEKVGEQAGEQFEARVLDRWRNLKHVRRFVFGWLILVGLLVFGVFLQNRQLGSYYLAEETVAGGTFREGLVGDITNMNPIFATRAADRAAARLQFNALFKYDSAGKVQGDLAESYTVNTEGTVYTVNLRRDVLWHDGQPFTAKDVIFTYEAIQHPDTRSYLNLAWRDITVEQKDEHIVTFTLPNPFAPFIHSLTEGGIIPEHILGTLKPSQLRGHEFNTSQPVGTGPFKFNELLELADQTTSGKQQLRLDKNQDYYVGEVQLDHFELSAFSDREEMVKGFLDGELAAVGGLASSDLEGVQANPELMWRDTALNNIVFIFLKTDAGPLKDQKVRQALSHATSQVEIQETALGGRLAVLDSPILPDKLGYDPQLVQRGYNVDEANRLLEEAGWHYNAGDQNDGYRYKDGARLSIDFVTQNSDDYDAVAAVVRNQWQKVGAEIKPNIVDDNSIQQNHISPHNYSALLLGVAMGADPDPFVYWHSSQGSTNGLNLSEVQDVEIDEALESGRTRLDDSLRSVKYRTFLTNWVDLSPAIALYRPAYSYAQRRVIRTYDTVVLNTPDERYNNVHTWQINTRLGARPY